MHDFDILMEQLKGNRVGFKMIAFKYGLLEEGKKFVEEANEFANELNTVSTSFDDFRKYPHRYDDFIEELADCIVSLCGVIAACEILNDLNKDVYGTGLDDLMFFLRNKINSKLERTIRRSVEGYYDEEARKREATKRRLDEIIEKGNK